MSSLEKSTLRVFFSWPLALLNRRVFLQFRPTFCRAGNPRVSGSGDALYDMLAADWGINDRGDLVRYYFLYLQLRRIEEQRIPGDLAELGVYQGNTAVFINRLCPSRTLHLFDTFAGFDERDSKTFARKDTFKDVSVDLVRSRFQNGAVEVYVGYFPETAASLKHDSRFSLVHIDLDLEAPIAAALAFFYPRLSPGGVIVVHDYNNVASWDQGAKKAVDRFLADKPECAIEMPDRFGSALIVKVRNHAES
jgi:O-methyltransferase